MVKRVGRLGTVAVPGVTTESVSLATAARGPQFAARDG
jgi:hypothetical protein